LYCIYILAAQEGELINSGKSLAVDCEDWADVIFTWIWLEHYLRFGMVMSPKASQATDNRSRHLCISGSVVVLIVLSSAKRRSLIVTS